MLITKKRSTLAILTIAFLALGITAAQAMQIVVRTPSHTSVILDVEPSDTIENVKTKIQDKTDLPPDQQHLHFHNQYLEDSNTLSQYNVQRDDVVTLVTDRYGKCQYIGDLCQYGDIGPGGGQVFILPSDAGNSTGSYFEIAPIAPERIFCSDVEHRLTAAMATEIGAGRRNSQLFYEAGCLPGSAIQFAHDYSANGLSDWFIPSYDELYSVATHNVLLGYTNVAFVHGSSYAELDGYALQHIPRTDTGVDSLYLQSDSYSSYPVAPVRMFTLTLDPRMTPPEFPSATQSDSISPVANPIVTGTKLVIPGNFSQPIQNIDVNGATLSRGDWIQSPSAIEITLPKNLNGNLSIQIYNGATPLLPPIRVKYQAPDSPVVNPATLGPITSCVKGKRTYKPKAPTCLAGYTAKRD